MIINFNIKVTGGCAKLDALNYIDATADDTFQKIADITGKTIDAYTSFIEGILEAAHEPEQTPPADIAKGEVVPDPTQTVTNCNPSKLAPAPKREPEPAKEEKPVTLEEVRKALIEVKKTKGAEGLKQCFDTVGEKSLQAVNPEKYAALLSKAQEVLHAK